MRKFLVLPWLLLCSNAQAQFYKSFLPSPAFSDSLSKVVMDFRHNYRVIQGSHVSSRDNMEWYNSKVSIPGASHCTIYRSHSEEDTTASFQAVMYSGDSYNAAVKAYKNTFRLVKKTQIKLADKSAINFHGDMDEPEEAVRFTVSLLKPELTDISYRHFFAEIEMVSSYDGWEVHLNLHNKRNDREE